MMGIGQKQYDSGSYDQAQKTFQMAQVYKDYLDPVEQRKLQSLQAKAGSAAVERKRVLEAKQAADESRRKGDAVAARARLESIKNSEFLTEQERLEVANALRGPGVPIPAPAVSVAAADKTRNSPVAPASKTPELQASASTAPSPNVINSVATEYYESVKAYRAGDLPTAKQGFTKVLQNQALDPQMAETVRGYLSEIEARQNNSQPALLAGMPARTLPAVGVTALANAPADANAAAAPAAQPPQSDVERIADLYTRSLELYSQGELAAARQGFVEVAKSGLFKGQAGKRPEDYIATIDRLLAAAPAAQPTPVAAAPAPVPPTVVPPAPAPTIATPVPAPSGSVVTSRQPVTEPSAPEQGNSIDVINRRKNIIRSHTEAVVNDAVTQAQKSIAEGEFNAAMDRVMDAQRVVNEAQFYLGEDLYKQHTQRLNQTADRIRNAQAEKAKQLAAQKRQEAAQAQSDLRTQAEKDRANRIKELMERAKAYWKQQQYEASLGQLEALLAIDPLNDEAQTLKMMVQDMIAVRKQNEMDQLSSRQRVEMLQGVDEAGIPYADEITYPKNWREVIQRPTRQPEKPFSLDPANEAVYAQLEQEVDLSQLTPTTAVDAAIDMLRKSVTPPLNIVVLWRDLQVNVLIEPTAPVSMDGAPKIKLGTALENLVKAISDPAYPENPVDFVVNKGVVTIATTAGLPAKKMETKVYDISDLVGQPASYSQMGQMMGMMGGMGGGMMGGGMMGGMGGMGGGMMGGMGGMGGGMMGGMGGGMGGGMMGGMGGMGGGMMGGGMGGMGGMGGGMMGGGMGGMGGGMMGGGMGGMGGGMMGGGMGMRGMMGGGTVAYSLRDIVMQSVNPNSWYDISTLDPPPEGQITLYPQTMPMKMAVHNTAEAHRQIEDLLDQLRKSLGNEVSIEARFLVVSQNFLEAIGLDLDLSYRPGGKWGQITFTQDSIQGAAPASSTKVPGSLGGLANSPAANIGGGWGTTLDELQVSLLLRATQGRSDSKALSAPKVTVMSGEGASFTLTDYIAYALPNTNQTTTLGGLGTAATTGGTQPNVSMMPIGSTLSITPTITKDKKYVLLNIVSTQTDLLGMKTLQVTSTNPNTTVGAPPTVTVPTTVPETESAQVATRVSVPDRGTLLLGGHKLAAKVDKEVGVPILSKIPILGRLFSNRSSTQDEKILLILVKPTIILQEETEHEAIAALEGQGIEARP